MNSSDCSILPTQMQKRTVLYLTQNLKLRLSEWKHHRLFFVCSDLELYCSNEAIDIFDPNKDYRARPRAQKETAEGCHCDDGVASNSRKQKGKGKVVDSSKKNKKPGRDGDGDGRTGAGADADADAD